MLMSPQTITTALDQIFWEKPTWQSQNIDVSEISDRAQVAQISAGFGLETVPETLENEPIRQGTRQRTPTEKCVENQVSQIDSNVFALLTKPSFYPISNPVTDADAMLGEHKAEWGKSRLKEMEEIWRTKTYKLVPRPPPPTRVLGSRFIDTIKWVKREMFLLCK